MTLSELEQKLSVRFPAKFHEIHASGAMEWMEISLAEFRENRDRYLNDSAAFMMLDCDCEPLFFEEVTSRMEELSEWLRWKAEDKQLVLKEGVTLIPFAQMGSGDLYCFLYEDGNPEPAIILYAHDDYADPDIIGQTFDEFLYVMLLNAVSYEEDIEGAHWKAQVQYLTEGYRAQIDGKDAEELTDMFYDIFFEKARIFCETNTRACSH